ncbi:hypothetical protein [Oceanobacillus manasiensis]|uniref:hypothetical protein n=1 Tax=Oceanobacillus manasiensis TaxID=586413 RepID=UPI0005AA8C68|nr:hypothetical protein [Oceanobacillus manasiensis]
MALTTAARTHVSALSFFIAAILFVTYPALRPFSDEKSLQGAEAFASQEWVLSHIFGMIAFMLLPLGLFGIHRALEGSTGATFSYWGFVLSAIGVGLILPYYGGETFGLYAIGQEALTQQSADLMSQAVVVRSGAGLVMFVIGLLLLLIASILLAIGIWKSSKLPKMSGFLFVLGMCLYLPQFFFDQPLRVAHGALVAISCIWLAVVLWSNRNNAP